jgi:hypothetical protein
MNPNVPYDPKVFHENTATHYVFARVYLPSEGPNRQFDGEMVGASENHCIVRTGAVEAPVRDYNVPASCVQYMYLGIKK